MAWTKIKSISLLLIIFFTVAYTAVNAASVPHQLQQKSSSAIISSLKERGTFACQNVSFSIAGSQLNFMVVLSTPSQAYQVGAAAGEFCNIYETNSTFSFPATGLSVYLKDPSMANASTGSTPETQYFTNGTYFCTLSLMMPNTGTFNVTASFTVVPVLIYGIYHFSLPGKRVHFSMALTGTESG